MIEFDGISFNDLISRRIVGELAEHDPSHANLAHEQISNRVGRCSFMASIAEINGLQFFPKIADYCDRSLHAACDCAVMTRGLFVPLCRSGSDTLIVAVANPWSPYAEEYLAPRFPELEIVKVVTLASEITRAIELAATSHLPSRSRLEAIDVEELDIDLHDFDVTRDYAEPMAQLISSIIADAVRTRASDIHVKVEKETFYYAFRVDGDIGMKSELPMKLKDRFDAFLLNLMKLPTEIRNVAPGISGRFTISYFHRSIDIRYERHRTYRGYHVTLRLLDKSHIDVALGKGALAFDEETMFALNRVMKIPSGIIVMSGPTGSGKSTTLNAILRELNTPDVNILTLENPVEDEVPGITHCDLKSSKEFKPMIAQTLKAACAQRLVKLLCPYCRQPTTGISELERKTFSLDESWGNLPLFAAKSGGCPECRHTGYSGRTAILEIIPITPKVSDQLSKGTMSPYELEVSVAQEGILPNLRSSGLRLVRDGKTDLAAISKVIDMTYAETT